MALTRAQVALELHEAGASVEDDNVDAAMRFIAGFHCEDCETYAEAKDKILASMEMISDECDASPERAGEILDTRYAWVKP